MTIRKMHPLITPDVAPEEELTAAQDVPLPAPYLDQLVLLDGWPGHRTMPGKLGLDPLENNTEAAHMAGVFVHYLLAGMPRTHGTTYLLLAPVLGLLLLAPFGLALYTAWMGDPAPLAGWAYMLPLALLGIVMLGYFGLRLWPARPQNSDRAG